MRKNLLWEWNRGIVFFVVVKFKFWIEPKISRYINLFFSHSMAYISIFLNNFFTYVYITQLDIFINVSYKYFFIACFPIIQIKWYVYSVTYLLCKENT